MVNALNANSSFWLSSAISPAMRRLSYSYVTRPQTNMFTGVVIAAAAATDLPLATLTRTACMHHIMPH